jgi:hypothetical protein
MYVVVKGDSPIKAGNLKPGMKYRIGAEYSDVRQVVDVKRASSGVQVQYVLLTPKGTPQDNKSRYAHHPLTSSLILVG